MQLFHVYNFVHIKQLYCYVFFSLYIPVMFGYVFLFVQFAL